MLPSLASISSLLLLRAKWQQVHELSIYAHARKPLLDLKVSATAGQVSQARFSVGFRSHDSTHLCGIEAKYQLYVVVLSAISFQGYVCRDSRAVESYGLPAGALPNVVLSGASAMQKVPFHAGIA